MKLVISLVMLNLIGCAAGVAPRSTAAKPAVQDGNSATTDTGNSTTGTPKPPPHPNV